ncbi:unnamed protein product, partial [Staurois parvus]
SPVSIADNREIQFPVINSFSLTLSTDYQCSPKSAQQWHPSVPISATYQRRLSVPIIAAYQCPSVLHISVASSVPPHQFPSVSPHQCSLSAPISAADQCHLISAYQCCLSVQPNQSI